ncbi:MAG: formylglycine-generating enzyme family protein [Pirellula sp.]
MFDWNSRRSLLVLLAFFVLATGCSQQSEPLKSENERQAAKGTSDSAEPLPPEPWDQLPLSRDNSFVSPPATAGMVAGETKQLTQLALRFSWCPAGTFRMGSPEDSVTHMLNEHPHDVTIARGFWLQQTEVTQTQYEAVMGVNPSHFRGADHPVDSVTWDEAQEFCRRLTSLASETSSGNQYRLPTESEWEYACRAGTFGDFSFGDDQKLFPDHGWGFENSGQATHPVGTKQPNPWSLSDLHGNVSEWCQDLYGDYPRESVTDPTGPGSGDKRVLRGGCWFHVPKYCRSAHREAYPATTRYVGLGFRVIVTLPAETNSESGEAAKGNATDSVRCLLFDQVAAGGSLCSSGFPARAPCWFF